MSKLCVNLVTFNGAKYIPYLFESLRRQSFQDWKLLIWDNHSGDDTVKIMERELNTLFVHHQLFENSDNIGFSGGHNQLFKKSTSKYCVILNQDIFLSPDCFKNLVKFMDNRPDVSAAAPRLSVWDYQALRQVKNSRKSNFLDTFTCTIDSLGLKVYRSRRVVDWLSGELWSNQSKNKQIGMLRSKKAIEIFGLSGALAIYKKSKVDEVVFENGNLFDQSYQNYKEDVDLAFRMRSHGLKSFVLLDTVAYHDRSVFGPDRQSIGRQKLTQPALVRYFSYRNHLSTLYKNEYWQNLLLDAPWIFLYEVRKIIWFLFFDKQTLKALSELYDNRHSIKKKRLFIKKRRILKWREIRTWWK